MSKNKYITIILTISLLLGIIGTINIIYRNESNEKITENFNNEAFLKDAGIKGSFDPYQIEIDGSATYLGSHNWTWAVSQSWCRGAGTFEDPYIIENLEIESLLYREGCLSIKNSNVPLIIQNCRFSEATDSSGIKLFNVGNATIINNEFRNNEFGIQLIGEDGKKGCKNCSINENILYYNKYGIKISDNSNNVTLSGNNIFYSDYGIYLTSLCNNITAFDNLMSFGGFFLDISLIDQLRSFKLDSTNIINGKNFYYYIDKEQLNTDDFTNGGQVILINCNHSSIFSLDVSHTAVGIKLIYCNNIAILQNDASNNIEQGIYIINCNNITILQNDASNNIEQGIYIINCNNITLQKNIVNNNNGNGISVYNAEYVKIIDNDIENNNENGIYLSSSNYCNISINSVNNNKEAGILIFSCYETNLTANSFIKGGIELSGTDKTQLGSHNIDTTNIVNGKIVYFYKNVNNLKQSSFINAGQIILINCNESIISNINITSVAVGMMIQYCKNITIIKCNSSNNRIGFDFENLIESRFINNVANKNDEEGIILIKMFNNTISRNDANNNGKDSGHAGFFISISNNNNITNNKANNCFSNGITIFNSNQNNFSKNEMNFNNETGLNIYECTDNLISSNILKGNGKQGIYLRESESSGKNNNITKNIMENCGLVYHVDTSKSMIKIIGNFIDNTNKVNNKPLYYYTNKKGLGINDFSNAGQIILINCSDSIISKVNVSYSSIGIAFYNCLNISISNSNSSFNSIYGMYIYICNSTKISGNVVNNNDLYGIYLTSTTIYDKDSIVSNNTVNYNKDIGIFIYNQYNDMIYNNTLIKNGNYGIYIVRGENNITANKMIECGLGLESTWDLEDMNGNSIDSLNLVNNKPLYYYVNKTGLSSLYFNNAGQIILVNCSFANISNVDLSRCSIGIALYHSNNNSISNINSTNNSLKGLYLYFSIKNNVTKSLFANNELYGIEINDGCIGNLIWNNIFIDNFRNAIDFSLNSSWNTAVIGNYWDDYTGRDLNDDWIGDTPYIVSNYFYLAQDKFPIWDDGPEPVFFIISDDDDDDEKEEVPPIVVPFGNYYLVFVVSAIITIMIYVKKRKINY